MTTLLVYLFDELSAVQVVAEDDSNYPDIANEPYLWGVLQDHRVMAEFTVKVRGAFCITFKSASSAIKR